ncbi:MAG: hypothetical protein LBB85_10880 [Dysgonamonadaceae bacterium]|jgi:hypothetical protein|nr:hypothetical protein [Dysgonamonadaceae bacterium]
MMDSTTISLFDNILKGVPMVVDLTSAAKHDHYLLKEVHLPKDSTLAIDRALLLSAKLKKSVK